MRIEKLKPWLRPTLVGPWLAMIGYVTVSILLGHHDPLLGGPLSNWVLAVLAGSLLSGGVSVALVAVDVLRTRRGLVPPEGPRAWLGSMLAFGLCVGLYTLWPPARHGGLAFAVALTWPALASATAARLITWR